MFKRHANSNMKLISRGAYAIAFSIPFISPVVETQASIMYATENKLFNESKYAENFEDTYKLKEITELNLNFDNILIAEETNQDKEGNISEEISEEKKVLISEIIIEGLEDHPDKERLEVIAYDAMLIRPGSKVTSEEVKKDLDRIYSSGWFSGLRIESLQSPLGVQLLIKVEPNPILNKIKIQPPNKKISNIKLNEIFNDDFGNTLNLNTLQIRIKEIKDWYNTN